MKSLCRAVALRLAREHGEASPSDGGAVNLDDEVLRLAVKHRVVPVIEPLLMDLNISSGIADAFAAMHARRVSRVMSAAHDQQRVITALAGGGVRVLGIKGLCLAVQTTGDMMARGVGDLDLLIDAADAERALRILASVGVKPLPGACPSPQSPLFHVASRIDSEAMYVLGGRHIDVHWRLDFVKGGLAWSFDDLWERRAAVDVGGHPTATLSAVDAAVFSAANGARDGWSTLRHVVDHCRLLRLIDPEEGRELAVEVGAQTRWGVSEVVTSKLIGGNPVVSQRARRRGGEFWRWLAADDGPGFRGGVKSTMRRFRCTVGLYDSPSPAVRRLERYLWPVSAMAERRLGEVGDDNPWLYAAAAPVLIPVHAWSTVRRP